MNGRRYLLRVERKWFSDRSTVGELWIGMDRFCFTLEDTVRGFKVQGASAIPEGNYETILNFSNRFQRVMPLLLNVKDYSGIRYHSGNKPTDTEGCILLGNHYDPQKPDWISESALAFDRFKEKIYPLFSQGKVFTQVTNLRGIE